LFKPDFPEIMLLEDMNVETNSEIVIGIKLGIGAHGKSPGKSFSIGTSSASASR